MEDKGGRTMHVTVQSQPGQGYRQAIQVRNHTIFADVPQAMGGQDTAPTPHELALAGLGACTSITLQMYAGRKKWDLQEVTVNVSETETPGPQPGQKMPLIQKDIQVRGNLDAQQLAMLKTIAEKCPVNKLFNEPKQTTSTLSLVV